MLLLLLLLMLKKKILLVNGGRTLRLLLPLKVLYRSALLLQLLGGAFEPVHLGAVVGGNLLLVVDNGGLFATTSFSFVFIILLFFFSISIVVGARKGDPFLALSWRFPVDDVFLRVLV